jgi:hypothetical protein
MLQEKYGQGICDTCIYRYRCVSLKNSIKEGKAVWYCEQFENYRPKNDGRIPTFVRTFVSLPGMSVKSLIPEWDSSRR